jgi:methyl-coenzyme M reductase gamma subunit
MPQYTAGNSHVAENRRKFMDPSYKLEKLRDIAEEDVVRLLAHRLEKSTRAFTHR